jgi:membrane-associated phospholipid phosphatase
MIALNAIVPWYIFNGAWAVCAGLVALSTLFTKQHYILDVIAGIGLACAGYALFLRRAPDDEVPPLDRRLAPVLAAAAAALVLVMTAGYWIVYEIVAG